MVRPASPFRCAMITLGVPGTGWDGRCIAGSLEESYPVSVVQDAPATTETKLAADSRSPPTAGASSGVSSGSDSEPEGAKE